MEGSSIAKKLSNHGYHILHLSAISLMVLAFVDLNDRYQRIGEKYSWLHEQRKKLGLFDANEHVQRQRRGVSNNDVDLLKAVRTRVDSMEFK